MKPGVSFLLFALACACGSSLENAAGDDGSPASEGGSAAQGGTNPGGGVSVGGASETGGQTTTGGSAEGGAGGTGGEGGCAIPSNPSSFELGTGEDCFERVSDGDTIPLMAGPQGGYHVWLALGCASCGDSLHTRWGVKDPTTGETIPNTYDSEAVVDVHGGSFKQHAGLFCGMPGIQWDPEAYPPLEQGAHFIMWAELVDDAGSILDSAQHELIVGETVVWDPCAENPEAPECMNG